LIQLFTEHPPRLIEDQGFSAEFCSFVNGCLEIDAEKRSTIRDLAEHKFLQSEEDDLDDWKKVLEPDLTDLDAVLGILTQELSFDLSDIEDIRQGSLSQSSRRLRNTPYRTYCTPSPREIGFSELSLNHSSSAPAGMNSSPSLHASQPSIGPLPALSTTLSPMHSRRSSDSSHSPVSNTSSLDCFESTPIPNMDSDAWKREESQEGEKSRETNLRLLLWVVHHLADQFGLTYDAIIARLALILEPTVPSKDEN